MAAGAAALPGIAPPCAVESPPLKEAPGASGASTPHPNALSSLDCTSAPNPLLAAGVKPEDYFVSCKQYFVSYGGLLVRGLLGDEKCPGPLSVAKPLNVRTVLWFLY
jgi:hypothetical protein